ncbi:ATP-binding protein [Massilia sp. W12]|uniref:ATP-binding protein n=1 Tax=Massilia sp. W12 TaxID=3126507 RepID=UPI0030CC83F1
MLEPIKPPDEEDRLHDLCGLAVLDTPSEERFDRITRTACRMFGVPTALISLVDANRQWFKSRQGLTAQETPRNISFCGHAILDKHAFVVTDAAADNRFADNPLVTGDLHLRFYAGYPLRGPRGFHIGTLCLIDYQARPFSPADEAALADLAAWAENELSNQALADALEQFRISELRLSETSRLHQAILNGCNFSIISTDTNGAIVTFNQGAQKMLGYSSTEMMGQSPAILHDAAEMQARAAQLSQETGGEIRPGFDVFVALARKGVVDEREWIYRRKDGSTLPVQLSVTALFDGPTVTGYLGIAYDLTERKRIESLKNEFISTVSHELRTPLTSIRGSIGLLAAGAVGEIPTRAKSLLDIAKSNCERLVRLINDILDIEKIESGNMRFCCDVHAINPLLEAAMGGIHAYAQQYGVHVELALPPYDVHVNVDPDRLSQVLLNLLSNAIKFSPAGGVVSLRLEALDDMVRISVMDRGDGIPEEFQARIFKKFAQADSSDTRSKGGTGLGLNISKAIVERLRGNIGFQSTVGQGSTFWVELPRVNIAPPQFTQDAQVLICEDDPDVARLLSMYLSQAAIMADIASDAAQARRMLLAHPYQALTLDLALPGEDGLSLLGWVRKQPALHDLAVIVVSAHAGDAPQQARGRAFGVLDWISKPFSEERLLQALQRVRDIHGIPHILYVGELTDKQHDLEAMLQRSFKVMHASNLLEAQDLLSDYSFALILLDLDVQGNSGAELLARLPERNRNASVVLLSSVAVSQEVAQRVEAALIKSDTSNESLLALLQKLISPMLRQAAG